MKTREFENKLKLTNDGQLSLFFLGTGTAFSKNYFQNNLLIVKGTTHLLVDCGTLCPYVIETKYNTDLSEIKNVFITHAHADHMGGLEELALKNYYQNGQKVSIVINDYFKKKLWNKSLKGGLEYSDKGKMCFDDYFEQYCPEKISTKPFEVSEIDFYGIKLTIFRTMHVTSRKDSFKDSQYSQGLIIDDKVFFSGDCQFKKQYFDWALSNYNLETIFHDCDVSGMSGTVHATYDELRTLSPEIKSKMLMCHYNKVPDEKNVQQDGFKGFVKAGIYYEW